MQLFFFLIACLLCTTTLANTDFYGNTIYQDYQDTTSKLLSVYAPMILGPYSGCLITGDMDPGSSIDVYVHQELDLLDIPSPSNAENGNKCKFEGKSDKFYFDCDIPKDENSPYYVYVYGDTKVTVNIGVTTGVVDVLPPILTFIVGLLIGACILNRGKCFKKKKSGWF